MFTISYALEFGDFILDTQTKELRRGPLSQYLAPRLYALLLTFLTSGGSVISKEQLLRDVWSDNDVTEDNVYQYIAMLRRCLHQHPGEAVYIATLPKRGYRFVPRVMAIIGLLMKRTCERCRRRLNADSEAYICSFECTVCIRCHRSTNGLCDTHHGEFVRRPRRIG